jgi:macrolide-specific efflux system membrane fusion protein
MTKLTRSLAWILVLLIVGGVAAYFYHFRARDGTDRFLTDTVETGYIEETVSAIGNLQPLEYVDVGTQVTGQLKTLRVAIGDTVKEGQLVAEIDPVLLQAKVDESRAQMLSLQAQLAERQAQQKLAAQQHARNKKLFAADAVSEEQLQQSAAAEEESAAQVSALRAQIQQTASQLKGNEANLRYTKIYAPMSGTVVSITARQGQTLVSSQQAPVILRIADLNTMTVWAQVSEADVPKIRVGMPVYFNTLGQTERRWTGKVRQILPTPETVNNVVLYNTLFDVANPDQVLKPQMSAQVYFVLAKADDALLVPSAALQPLKRPKADAAVAEKPKRAEERAAGEGGKKAKTYLVRVVEDGQVEEREVRVGVMTRLQAQVISGLAEGETVVVGVAQKEKEQSGRRLPVPGRAF